MSGVLRVARSGLWEVSCGYTNSCGIRDDGSLVCWGSNTGFQ